MVHTISLQLTVLMRYIVNNEREMFLHYLTRVPMDSEMTAEFQVVVPIWYVRKNANHPVSLIEFQHPH